MEWQYERNSIKWIFCVVLKANKRNFCRRVNDESYIFVCGAVECGCHGLQMPLLRAFSASVDTKDNIQKHGSKSTYRYILLCRSLTWKWTIIQNIYSLSETRGQKLWNYRTQGKKLGEKVMNLFKFEFKSESTVKKTNNLINNNRFLVPFLIKCWTSLAERTLA